MFVKQISVFIENTSGRLADFTNLLAENSIDLISLSIADTADYGILRGIVSDYNRAYEIITKSGYTAKITDVIAVSVPDKPGGLSSITKLFADNSISIEYLYSSARSADKHALIIFRVDKPKEAAQILKDNNINMYCQENVRSMEIA